MKRNIIRGIFPLAVLCLLFSCDKEEVLQPNATQKAHAVTPVIPDVTTRVELQGSLLSFDQPGDFESMVHLLDDADDKWQDEFLHEVAGLTPADLAQMTASELDDLADQLELAEGEAGITGDLVYATFEAEIGLESLRALIDQQEEKFLNQPNPDWNDDPDNHYIQGTAERSLLNERGEVMVAGILYKFMPNGLIYEVTDGNFETLAQIGEEHAETLFEAPNVVAYNTEVLEEGRRTCRTWVFGKDQVRFNDDLHKMKMRLGHGSMIFYNRVYSTVKHYKWNGRRWKKRRAALRTKNWGSHGFNDPGNLVASCNQQVDYKSAEKARFRRRITVRYSTMGIGFGKVKSGMVHAFFEANGHREARTLNF